MGQCINIVRVKLVIQITSSLVHTVILDELNMISSIHLDGNDAMYCQLCVVCYI